MNSIFDTLRYLPLLQGMSDEEFKYVTDKVRLNFVVYRPGETITISGCTCDHLIYVLRGDICVQTSISGVAYSVIEHFQVPYLIEPFTLMGSRTAYISTSIAYSEIHTLQLDKSMVSTLLLKYQTFQLNYLNLLCTHSQLQKRICKEFGTGNLEKRIAAFSLSSIHSTAGEKYIKIRMIDLAHLMNETRINVSKALKNMKDAGLISLHKGGIVIPAANLLLQD